MNAQRPRPLLLLVTVAAIAGATTFAALAEQRERRLGTIGPPPRQDPQRQTSAEGLPPLPLPVVPLRRSEPKAEPAPPLFVGKLRYGTWQDYMPNPGDIDNLLRHVRSQIDAWYGWTLYGLDEVVAAHEGDEPVPVPMIYMSGYHPFEFSDQERLALRQYLLDGGTLVAEATLGSPAFTESFREQMQRIFPQRRLVRLDIDHPLYRGYYDYSNVHYFSVDGGIRTRSEGPPEFYGINIAARTAVIFSPFDMSCGWDEFYAPPASERVPEAPRTRAMMPEDAVRMGINIVAYVSAQRRFATAQAQTRQIIGQQPDRRAAVPLALLRHQGDWNPDPNSLYQLIRQAAQRTSMPVAFELKAVDPVIEQLAETPLVVMTGMDEPGLDEREVEALRRHVLAGGFLFINNTSGFARFDREARALIGRILPEHELEPLDEDHPVFSSLFQIQQMRDAGTGRTRPAQLEGVSVRGRTVVIYSPNDTLAMLKGIHDPYANAYDTESATRLSLNILTYAIRR